MNYVLVMLALLAACAPVPAEEEPGSAPVRLMLHGGGSEDDAVFSEFVAAAGNGRIVTLGAVADDDPDRDWWNNYFMSLGAVSAATLNASTRGDAEAQAGLLADADGVFVRGGDQGEYLALWEGNAVQLGVQAAWDRGAVLGGSSAGCALLGARVYDARNGSVDSYEALLDPFDDAITFTDGFLDVLPGVLTDTHFVERGRFGRLAVFVARWDGGLGLGVDPRTALFVRDDGTAFVRGDGSITLIDAAASAATLAPSTPLDVRGLRVWQLPAGYELDLHDPTDPVLARPPWVAAVEPADALAWTATSLNGDDAADRELGAYALTGLDDDPYAWEDGRVEVAEVGGELAGTLVLTRLYDDSERFMNHQGALGQALGTVPGLVVVAVDVELTVDLAPPASLFPRPGSYALVYDGRTADAIGVAPEGWPSGAFEGVTVDVVGASRSWP